MNPKVNNLVYFANNDISRLNEFGCKAINSRIIIYLQRLVKDRVKVQAMVHNLDNQKLYP